MEAVLADQHSTERKLVMFWWSVREIEDCGLRANVLFRVSVTIQAPFHG